MRFRITRWAGILPVLSCCLPIVTSAAVPRGPAAGDQLEEVVVTAEFRPMALGDVPASISVIDGATVQRWSSRHLEQLLNLAPNVNFASGASRGKFIQIRGIGERSQFVEPLNPSVGLLIDNLDFTGAGGAATTLDIEQVEILRGPQGTLYGANALAGLINLRSRAPTETLQGRMELSVADYDTVTASIAAGGPAGANAGWRLALQQHRSDGYIENDYLDDRNTNDLDEFTGRARWRWQPTEDWQLDTVLFHVDADNGYDAFSLDNTRHTLSDQPGQDSQQSTALGLESTWSGSEVFNWVALLGYSDSDLDYAYDEDWSYPDICTGTPCEGWEYSSYDDYQRDRGTATAEMRLVSGEGGRLLGDRTDWVVGVYLRRQQEDLLRQYTYAESDFTSDYDTDNVAGYLQLDTALSERLTLVTGLRLERFDADYVDSESVGFDLGDEFWGGKLALQYDLTQAAMGYVLVSRGYKAGGVNSSNSLPTSLRDYDDETMWNYEVGLKAQGESGWQVNLAVFYQQRDDVQLKQSLVQPIEGELCPCSFTDYTANSASGNNYGAELELGWQANDRLHLTAALGWLETEFEDFVSYSHVDVDPDSGIPVNLDGREQAHAPRYQAALTAEWFITERLSLALDAEGKGAFYLSNRHDERTNAYELLHARLAYQWDDWEFSLWGRNLTDEDYIVRGFGEFGNDPRKFYEVEPYYQYGEPRVLGASVVFEF